MIICARNECQVEFTPKTHNQKYCGKECCKIETNRRIMENYYKERDKRAGKVRYCENCKTTRLSRYNNGDICGSCSTLAAETSKKNMLAMISAIAV